MSLHPELASGVRVMCPFCKGMVEIGYDHDKEPTALHSLPPCETFVKTELVDFTAKVRRHYEGD